MSDDRDDAGNWGCVLVNGDDTVRLTWWSASGLQEREVAFDSIEKVELNGTGGSKNPFSVRVEGEWCPQYCRSIEWPENRCLRVGDGE